MNKQAFFAALRKRDSGLFGTSLSQAQVDGLEAVLHECILWKADLPQAAYILATAYGETGGKMQPTYENLRYSAKRIPEVFSASRRQGLSPAQLAGNPELLANTVYGGEWGRKNLGNTEPGDGWRFRGTGIPQVTGRRNFGIWDRRLGLPLLEVPEMLMDLNVSARALVRPMLDGWATGLKLGEFVGGDKRDYRNARRVWNGLFQADRYADYARAFERALLAADYRAELAIEPDRAERNISQTNLPTQSIWALIAEFLVNLFRSKS